MNFMAMDLETTSAKRFSACSLAIPIVRNSQIQDEFYTLINPQTQMCIRDRSLHPEGPEVGKGGLATEAIEVGLALSLIHI